MPTNLEQFYGTYKYEDRQYVKEDGSIILHPCKRKQPTAKKPEKYFLFERAGIKTYFSSLYPTQVPDVYRAEYQKELLRVSFNSDQTASLYKWKGGK